MAFYSQSEPPVSKQVVKPWTDAPLSKKDHCEDGQFYTAQQRSLPLLGNVSSVRNMLYIYFLDKSDIIPQSTFFHTYPIKKNVLLH